MRRQSAESASGPDAPFRFIGLFGHTATTSQDGHTPATPLNAYTIPPLRHATPTICPADSLPMSQARWPIDNLVIQPPPEGCFDVAHLALPQGTSALGGRRSWHVRPPPIALAFVVCAIKNLQVRRDMKPAHQFALQRDNVVNMLSGSCFFLLTHGLGVNLANHPHVSPCWRSHEPGSFALCRRCSSLIFVGRRPFGVLLSQTILVSIFVALVDSRHSIRVVASPCVCFGFLGISV
jgi:hypothetical protein